MYCREVEGKKERAGKTETGEERRLICKYSPTNGEQGTRRDEKLSGREGGLDDLRGVVG